MKEKRIFSEKYIEDMGVLHNIKLVLRGERELTDKERLFALDQIKNGIYDGHSDYSKEALLLAMKKDQLDIAKALISKGVREIDIKPSDYNLSNLSDTENLIRCYIKPNSHIKFDDFNMPMQERIYAHIIFCSFFAGVFIQILIAGSVLPNLMPVGIGVALPFIAAAGMGLVCAMHAFIIKIKTPSYESRLNYCKEKNIITVDEYGK